MYNQVVGEPGDLLSLIPIKSTWTEEFPLQTPKASPAFFSLYHVWSF